MRINRLTLRIRIQHQLLYRQCVIFLQIIMFDSIFPEVSPLILMLTLLRRYWTIIAVS